MKKALLIIDIQKDYTGPKARMPVSAEQATRTIINLNALTKRIDQSLMPVIYIGNEFKLSDPANLFRNFATIKNSKGCEPDERLNIVSQNYYTKQKNDAFSNPGLASALRRHGVSTVVLAGLFAEGCVLATLKGAMQNGFKVEILRDAVATSSLKKLQQMLKKYEHLGATLLASHRLHFD